MSDSSGTLCFFFSFSFFSRRSVGAKMCDMQKMTRDDSWYEGNFKIPNLIVCVQHTYL